MSTRWRVGDDVLLRHVGSARAFGWPHKVVSDDGDVVLLYMPEGTEIPRVRLGGPSHELQSPLTSQMDVLRVLDMRRRYSVWLVWVSKLGTAPHWPHFEGPARFRGWKADVHSLPVRTEHGFDLTDDSLDLIVKPDRQSLRKDGAHFLSLVEAGIYSPADAEKIYQACDDAERAVAERRFPFDDSLIDWRPDPSWRIPRPPPDAMSCGDIETNLTTGRPFDPRF